MSDLFTDFPQLSETQQQRFRDCVSRLLAGHILSPGSAINPDPDWQFIDHHSDVVDDYLGLAGWRLDIDRRLGIARVLHQSGEQRVHLPKLESLAFCVLRLCYHEQRLHMREEERCRVTVGELRERLIHAGVAPLSVSRAKLRDATKLLARYHLVQIERGFTGEDEESIVVSEVIEKILSPERIAQYVAEYHDVAGVDDDRAFEQGAANGAPSAGEV